MDVGAIAMPVLGTLGLVGFWVAMHALLRRQERATRDAVTQWLAPWRARGWRVEQSGPMEFVMEGELDGVPVRWEQRMCETQAGDESRFAVACSASAPSPVDIGGLEVLPEEGLARIGKAFGAQDLQLGDASFDRAFVVRAADPAAAHRALGPRARAAMCGALERVQSMELRGGRVVWSGGSVTRVIEPEAAMREVAAVARSLGG